MAFIPVPDACEAVFMGEINGHNAFWTLGFEKASGFLVADLAALATALGGWWDTELSQHISSSLSLTGIKMTALDSITAPTYFYNGFANTTGQVSMAPVQDSTAMIIKFTTLLRGRSYRGRNYIPGLPQAALTNSSQWNVITLANVVDSYNDLPGILDAYDVTHVVISRYADLAPRVTGVTTPVDNYIGVQKIGVQRRRVTGTGS